MKIAVIGTGYVGLVTGVVLADLGNDVICVDKDPVKVALLREGIAPIYEPGVEEMLKRSLEGGFLRISDSIREAVRHADVVFIAVGTPPAADGTPDLTAVRDVASEIAKHIDHPIVVVNKSTVPVGSGGMVEEIIRAAGVPDAMFDVVSNPEFLREGSAIRDTLSPDRIVIGARRREAAVKLIDLYATLEAPMIVTDLNSAELIKYGANSFLALKISYINALSRICELCDANVADVAKGIGADARIGKLFLQAGLGYGGSCFPKDVQGMYTVAKSLGYDFKLLDEVMEINRSQSAHFIDRLRKTLGGFEGKRVGLLGLAFKPNTDDIRDAKSLEIIAAVEGEGGCIRAYDPVAMEGVRKLHPDVDYAENVYEVARDADALMVVTEWNEFRQLDLARLGSTMRRKVLFDGRRIYTRQQAERAGFEFATIGS